jgi:hypothetical protein
MILKNGDSIVKLVHTQAVGYCIHHGHKHGLWGLLKSRQQRDYAVPWPHSESIMGYGSICFKSLLSQP